jgi:glycosyltransferase involved in cell wall biosynthesis
VWLGVEPGLFPAAPLRAAGEGPLRLLFFGQFSPLHGVEVIVAAARLLEERGVDVEWTLVGRGQVSARIDADLAGRAVRSVRRIDWVPFEQLGGLIAGSDVCLGIFGTTRKGAVTLQNKTFQALAVGRHVLTADTPAMRELLEEAPSVHSGVTLIAAGDPAALADAVERLALDWAAGRAPESLSFAFGPESVARQFESVLG